MATIVNNPGPERVVEVDRTGDSTGGWAVAVVILIAVIVGIFAWVHYHPATAPTSTGGSNINVTLPAATNPPANSGGAAAGGASGGTGTGY